MPSCHRRQRRREDQGKGEQSLVQKWFFEVGDCEQEDIREVLRMVEIMYNRCGSAKKAFTAGTLRREFSKVPGLMKKGKFSNSDLDIIAARYKDVAKGGAKESFAEAGMSEDLVCRFSLFVVVCVSGTSFFCAREAWWSECSLPAGPHRTFLQSASKAVPMLVADVSALSGSERPFWIGG